MTKRKRHGKKNDKNLNKSPKYDEKRTEITKTCQEKCKNQKRLGQKREILRMKGQKRKQKRVSW